MPLKFSRFRHDEEGEVEDQSGARVHSELQDPAGRLQEDAR